MVGWPTWLSPGGGGEAPAQPRCDFASNKLKWCARLDFRRGLPEDDLLNEVWSEILSKLPLYQAVLRKQQNPSSDEGRGNAMEMAVGLAYTCFVEFKNLEPGHSLEFKTNHDKATKNGPSFGISSQPWA